MTEELFKQLYRLYTLFFERDEYLCSVGMHYIDMKDLIFK